MGPVFQRIGKVCRVGGERICKRVASAGAPDAARHLAEGLAILKRLHAQGRLTADQEGWIAMFEAALREPGEETARGKAGAVPWWKFWRG